MRKKNVKLCQTSKFNQIHECQHLSKIRLQSKLSVTMAINFCYDSVTNSENKVDYMDLSSWMFLSKIFKYCPKLATLVLNSPFICLAPDIGNLKQSRHWLVLIQFQNFLSNILMGKGIHSVRKRSQKEVMARKVHIQLLEAQTAAECC